MRKTSVKALFVFIPFALIFALVFLCAQAFPESKTAQADDAERYILAPVSDLKDNAEPTVSSIAVKDYSSGDVLFYLPESYYVKYVRLVLGTTYEVEYAGVRYVVDKAELEPVEVRFATGVSPYPDETSGIYIRRELAPDKSVVLQGVTISSADDYTFKFLGFSRDGSGVYVSATKNNASVYGMLQKSDFLNSDLPYHPIAAAQRKSLIDSLTPPAGGGNIVPNTSTALRILLIIGIAVPAIIIVILLFKPSKDSAKYEKRPLKNYSKNNDYDRDREYRGRRKDHDKYERSDEFKDGKYEREDRYYDERDRSGRYYERDDRYREDRYRDDRDERYRRD